MGPRTGKSLGAEGRAAVWGHGAPGEVWEGTGVPWRGVALVTDVPQETVTMPSTLLWSVSPSWMLHEAVAVTSDLLLSRLGTCTGSLSGFCLPLRTNDSLRWLLLLLSGVGNSKCGGLRIRICSLLKDGEEPFSHGQV